MNEEQLRALAMIMKALSATSPQVIPPHGPGGLLTAPGMSPNVLNAMVMPVGGLEAAAPVRLSNERMPIMGLLTGLTESTGEEPTAACAVPTLAGSLKMCHQSVQFGRLTKQSQVIRIDNAGEILNRSEFLDQRLVGNPFLDVPTHPRATIQDALRNKASKALFELMAALYRDYKRLVIIGNPANTAGSQGYIEMNGLDRLINNNHVDIFSGQRCAAADSVVINFGGKTVAANADELVTLIIEMYQHFKRLARQLTLDVSWRLVMNGGLFWALTAVWPCSFLTTACASDNMSFPASDVINMRDSMREGSYLLIGGERLPVIIEDAIEERVPVAGTFESDFYFIPWTVNGEPVFFTEYFNFRGPQGAQSVIEILGAQNEYMISPDGRFLFHYLPADYWCKQVAVVTWKRFVLAAPFLAAKVVNVRYTNLFHDRSPFPDDPYYFVNGGRTTGPDFPYTYPPFS